MFTYEEEALSKNSGPLFEILLSLKHYIKTEFCSSGYLFWLGSNNLGQVIGSDSALFFANGFWPLYRNKNSNPINKIHNTA